MTLAGDVRCSRSGGRRHRQCPPPEGATPHSVAILTQVATVVQDVLCQLDSVICAVQLVHNVGRALRVCFMAGGKWFCHAHCVGPHVSAHFRRFSLLPRSLRHPGMEVWSVEMVDLILRAAPFALLAFLFLVALPFPERLCPWLAALFSDAFSMPLVATLFVGWIFQLGYGFVARDCFQHFCFALYGLCPG